MECENCGHDHEAMDQRFANVIREHLDEVFPENAPHLIVRWFFCATFMDKDGDEGFMTHANLDAKSWDVLGMLDYAKKKEHSRITKWVFEEDE